MLFQCGQFYPIVYLIDLFSDKKKKMGFRTKKSRKATKEEQQEEEQTDDEKKDKNKDKDTEEKLPELPSYMKLPFGRFKGLSR